MNNTWITIGAVVVGLGAAVGVTYLNKKKRDESWEGKVVDKAVREHVDRDPYNNGYYNRQNRGLFTVNLFGTQQQPTQVVTHTYMITVALDNGQQFPWEVSSGSYDLIQIGDRVAKRAGTMNIEVIQAAAQAPVAQAQQAPVSSQPAPVVPTPVNPVVVPPISDQQHPPQQ